MNGPAVWMVHVGCQYTFSSHEANISRNSDMQRVFLVTAQSSILQVIKIFLRNLKNIGMAVVNKVRKQSNHYSTLHCPTYMYM